MKKAISNIGPKQFALVVLVVWSVLLIVDRVAPFVLSLEAFYFRPVQYLSGGKQFGLRRTNETVTMSTYGDLANMLGVASFRQPHMVTMTVDSLGNRNSLETQHDSPEIILVGDSFGAGVLSSDSETLATRLQEELAVPVRAYASRNMSDFLAEEQWKQSPPKVVVWEIVERNLSAAGYEVHTFSSSTVCDSVPDDRWKTPVKKVVAPVSEYVQRSVLRRYFQNAYLDARYQLFKKHTDRVVVSEYVPGMLYLAKGVRMLARDAESRGLAEIVTAVHTVRDCLANRGIELVFLPAPDKPHAYTVVDASFEALEPNPLGEIIAALEQEDIRVVRLLPEFQRRIANGEELYWKDDTHWNARGMDVAAELLKEELQ